MTTEYRNTPELWKFSNGKGGWRVIGPASEAHSCGQVVGVRTKDGAIKKVVLKSIGAAFEGKFPPTVGVPICSCAFQWYNDGDERDPSEPRRQSEREDDRSDTWNKAQQARAMAEQQDFDDDQREAPF